MGNFLLDWLESDEYKKIVDGFNRSLDSVGENPSHPTSLDAPRLSFLEPPEPVAPEPDLNLASLVSHPCVVLILGHRGNGKTALACRLQELKKDVAAPYGVGLPPKTSRLLPEWYGLTDDFTDIPSNSVIYVPES